MLEFSKLKALFLAGSSNSPQFKHPLREAVEAYLKNEVFSFDELIDSPRLWEPPHSEEQVIENWKTLLSLNLLSRNNNANRASIVAKLNALLKQPWNEQSQYCRTWIALNHLMAHLPTPECAIHLLENGAGPLDMQEYCPWLALPYAPQHAEWGTILCLYASLTQDDKWSAAALKVAHWQLNTLDFHFLPCQSLFSKESDGDLVQHLTWNYLFFYAIAKLLGQKEFMSIAQVQIDTLSDIALHHLIDLPPLAILLENYLDESKEKKQKEHSPIVLEQHIYDPSMALVGFRNPDYYGISTLHGNQTGLGCFAYKDAKLITYGPQYLPLGDCTAFGIEGNKHSDHGARKSEITKLSNGFLSKGCVRMVDQPDKTFHFDSSLSLGHFRGIWMEIEQKYQDANLQLDLTMMGLNGWEGTSFSFYVKASECYINGKPLKSTPFAPYKGVSPHLEFKGIEGQFELKGPDTVRVEVIPLEGKRSFWGANYLISYAFEPERRRYNWEVRLTASG